MWLHDPFFLGGGEGALGFLARISDSRPLGSCVLDDAGCRWHYTANVQAIRRVTLAREGFEHVTSLCGWFPNLVSVQYYITVSETAIRTLDGMFPRVTTLGGFTVESNRAIVTLGSALPLVATIGTDFRINHNPMLESFGSSFAALARISDEVYINNNCKLSTIGTAFASLRSGYISYICWNNNGDGCNPNGSNQNIRANFYVVVCSTYPIVGVYSINLITNCIVCDRFFSHR